MTEKTTRPHAPAHAPATPEPPTETPGESKDERIARLERELHELRVAQGMAHASPPAIESDVRAAAADGEVLVTVVHPEHAGDFGEDEEGKALKPSEPLAHHENAPKVGHIKGLKRADGSIVW